MRYLHVEGISDCPVCHAANDRSDPQRNGRRIPHEALRAVVVEANRDVATRPGWHDIPDRSALIVGADRQPDDLVAVAPVALGAAGSVGSTARRRRSPRSAPSGAAGSRRRSSG